MSIRFKTGKSLFIDLELTCWDGEPPAGMVREIIEIGIVELDTESFETREAGYLVKPVRSEISDYCTELTGITSDEVRASGRPLGEVLRSLAKEFGPGKKTTMAWGDDWQALYRDCAESGIENPFPQQGFVNIGQVASLLIGGGNRLGLDEARSLAGLEMPPGRHRALTDARATAELFASLAAMMRPSATAPTP